MFKYSFLILIFLLISSILQAQKRDKLNRPATEKELLAQKNDPKGDLDGDGVLNQFDQCIGQWGGKKASKREGCPRALDSDKDGDTYPDRFDECPTERGSPADKGCPKTSNSNQVEKSKKESSCIELDNCADEDNDKVSDNLDQCLGSELYNYKSNMDESEIALLREIMRNGLKRFNGCFPTQAQKIEFYKSSDLKEPDKDEDLVPECPSYMKEIISCDLCPDQGYEIHIQQLAIAFPKILTVPKAQIISDIQSDFGTDSDYIDETGCIVDKNNDGYIDLHIKNCRAKEKELEASGVLKTICPEDALPKRETKEINEPINNENIQCEGEPNRVMTISLTRKYWRTKSLNDVSEFCRIPMKCDAKKGANKEIYNNIDGDAGIFSATCSNHVCKGEQFSNQAMLNQCIEDDRIAARFYLEDGSSKSIYSYISTESCEILGEQNKINQISIVKDGYACEVKNCAGFTTTCRPKHRKDDPAGSCLELFSNLEMLPNGVLTDKCLDPNEENVSPVVEETTPASPGTSKGNH